MGEIYLSQNKYVEAIETANKVLKAFPSGQKPPQREETSAHFILGRAYLLQAGQTENEDQPGAKALYEKARVELQQVIAVAPNLAGARYSMGLVNSKLGNPQQAIAEFEEVLRISPDHIPSLVNVAIVYFQEGQYDSAIERARKVTELDPKNQTAYDILGRPT